MVGIKNNRRTQYTKRQLQKALLQLLKTQPLDKISVTAICQQAGLNRGTFYTHYADPAALFKAIENDLAKQIKPYMEDTNRPLTAWLPPILALIRQQEAATQIVISDIDDNPLMQALLNPLQVQSKKMYARRFHETNPALVNYYYQFLYAGGVKVITTWLKTGAKESPAAIAQVIANLAMQP